MMSSNCGPASGSKGQVCSGGGGGGRFFEDEPVQCSIKVPETYMFKCPGDMCDNNNNKAPPPPEPPKVRPMPKTDCSNKCSTPDPVGPSPSECKTPPKVNIEDNPPPMATKLPDTKSFKCPGEGCCGGEKQEEKPKEKEEASSKKPTDCVDEKPKASPEMKKAESCLKCGAPVAGKPCNCSRPLPPTPKPPPCGCKGANCGPNTSCDVSPLTMKRI